MTRAAVLTRIGEPLEVVDDLEVAPPGPGEVRVDIAHSGICHSDLSAQNGTVPFPVPVVLGHEGAGVVTEVGSGVTSLQPGDHIIVSWVPQCGRCFHCTRGQGFLCETAQRALVTGGLLDGTTRMSRRGQAVHQMAVAGTFAASTIIPESGAIPIPADVPLSAAALVGCGVLTGVGAALNTAHLVPGDTAVVIGCGGVGLNVIQGARLAGAACIIAVDLRRSKLDLAVEFGATHTVDATSDDALAAVLDLTSGRGADVAFEVIGLEATINQAVRMARRGGQVVLVGAPAGDARLNVRVFGGLLTQAKTIHGCWYGSSNARVDIPRVLTLYSAGRLRLDELISRHITLDGVNDALGVLASGEVARIMIDHDR